MLEQRVWGRLWEGGGSCVGSSLGWLDSERALRTVAHGGWYSKGVTTAFTATPQSPPLHSSEISNVLWQKRI